MTARIGVVGCGWWSTFAHLPALRSHPDAEIAALADPDPQKLAAAARDFDVSKTYESTEAMLSEEALDGVVIAVPHGLHYELASITLGAGLHTLLEKPMVLEPAHGRELIEIAAQTGAELLIGYPWHYNAQATSLREAIANGRVGVLEHVNCLFASTARELYKGRPEAYRELFGYTTSGPGAGTYSDPRGGGQGHTQVTHSAALLLWLTGLEVEAVSAFTERFELPVDLADALAVRFVGGAIGTLGSVGSVQPGQPELLRCEIFGAAGHALFDVNEGIASLHGAQRSLEKLPPLSPDDRYPLHAPAHNLVGVALGRERNGSPGTFGLATVELVTAMHRSARERRIVTIEEVRG